MLMFAKHSLNLFVYDMIDVFWFPDETIGEICNRYQIEKCFLVSKFNKQRQHLVVVVHVIAIPGVSRKHTHANQDRRLTC